MANPRVDIICLVHNNLPITDGFQRYLFDNTSNFRLIFVDNGSTDQTVDFLNQGKKKGKWDLITSSENLGVIGGRNLGAKHVEADFFLNIDNDQYVKSGWLESLFSIIDQGYDIAGSEAWVLFPPNTPGQTVVDGQTIPDRSYFPCKHCKNPHDKFTYIGCGGMLIKKSVYDTIGLFDDVFSPAFFEDPDFGFRAIQAGFKLGWQPKNIIEHLAHQTFNHQQLFSKNSQFVKSWMVFRKKWHPYFPELLQMS